MSNAAYIETVKQGWTDLANGDLDALAAAYAEDMVFVIPGQNNVINGRRAFRSALDALGEALPPGFEITALHYYAGEVVGELANVVEWKSTKIPDGTQSAIRWRFNDAGEITEERWFVDTEQWKAAF